MDVQKILNFSQTHPNSTKFQQKKRRKLFNKSLASDIKNKSKNSGVSYEFAYIMKKT